MAAKTITCPTCFSPVSIQNAFHGVLVCRCGEVISSRDNSDEGFSTSFWLVAITVMVMAGILHAVNWDNYALEIIPLKTKEMLGSASVPELKRIAEICQNRKKYMCQEAALFAAYRLNTKDIESLIKVGDLQASRLAHAQAVNSYAVALKAKNSDPLLRYSYAKSLLLSGKASEAKKQLHYLVFNNKSKVPQVGAARDYVSLLIKSSDYTTAKRVIDHTRGMGSYTALFLEKEYRVIAQRISAGSIANAR